MKHLFLLLLAPLFFFATPVFAEVTTAASKLSTYIPFGGQILDKFYCNCSNNYLITIRNLASTKQPRFIYQPGPKPKDDNPTKALPYTLLFDYRQLEQRVWILGLAGQLRQCRVYSGNGCYTKAIAPQMLIVGTADKKYVEAPFQPITVPVETPPGGGPTEPPVEPPTGTTTPPTAGCGTDLSGWNFNSGIERQIGDASPELRTLLSCMCGQLKQNGITGTITSISDLDHIGELYVCQRPNRPATCDHGRTSCHYGGDRGDNKSYAADIGRRAGSTQILRAARACGAATSIDEGNHIHVAVPACRSND